MNGISQQLLNAARRLRLARCFQCLFLVLLLTGGARAATLLWDNNPAGDMVVGYRVYSGAASGIYTSVLDVGDSTSAFIPVSETAPTYFAITAYNADGLESGFSSEVVYTPGPQPKSQFHLGLAPPILVTVTNLQTNAVPAGALSMPCVAFEQTFVGLVTGVRTVLVQVVPEGESRLLFTHAWPTNDTPKSYVRPQMVPRANISLVPPVSNSKSRIVTALPPNVPPAPVKKAPAPKKKVKPAPTAGRKQGKLL